MKRITVLLAEDHMVVRQGLRAILSAENDIEIVGEASNGRQAVELTQKLRPDVVVMDIAMPLLNGLEATRQILKLRPGTKVLILARDLELRIITQHDGELIRQLTLDPSQDYQPQAPKV